ncbi:MAG: class I SAM-dependent methyltransferase, partial [Candidatus Eisenbacteria bacterium]
CRGCRMRFLGVQPAPESLVGLYDASYFDSEFRCGRAAAPSFDEAAFREENRGLLDDFAALGARGRLLDVGCATGWLVQHANERGWQAQGVELSSDAAAHACSRGLAVFRGDLLEARLPAAHFDVVYMGDVLEHVPDCRAVVVEVARVLKPGGWLYLRGPVTTNSIARALALGLYRALGRTIVLHEVPYHLWEFTPRSLARLMAACGLTVTRVRQSKIPPGRARGEKSTLQRAAMAAIDALNLPLTILFNVRGDRVVMVARKPA